MSRHHRPTRRRESIASSTESAMVLARDSGYPPQAKAAMRLLRRGGRSLQQRCLACGQRGIHQALWLPAAVLAPVPDETAAPQAYWLCNTHHGVLTDGEVVTLLRQRDGHQRSCGKEKSR